MTKTAEIVKTDCRQDDEGRIKIATINTPALEQSAADYQRWFGYEEAERGTVAPALAASWGAPGQAGRPYVVLKPTSGSEVFIRLVEGTPVPDYKPLRSFGWAAIELTVQDADALHEELKASPFKIIGPPAWLDFSDAIYPMQCVGRAGEPLYLNQVNKDLPAFNLPLARTKVDHVFITILATPKLEEALKFYVDGFGWTQGNTFESPYSVINNAFGFPKEQKHRFSMTCVGREVNNEIDQYPDGTVTRPRIAGELPPGVAMVSYITQSIDAAKVKFLSPPQSVSGVGYNGRRAATTVGAAGELIELIERA